MIACYVYNYIANRMMSHIDFTCTHLPVGELTWKLIHDCISNETNVFKFQICILYFDHNIM